MAANPAGVEDFLRSCADALKGIARDAPTRLTTMVSSTKTSSRDGGERTGLGDLASPAHQHLGQGRLIETSRRARHGTELPEPGRAQNTGEFAPAGRPRVTFVVPDFQAFRAGGLHRDGSSSIGVQLR